MTELSRKYRTAPYSRSELRDQLRRVGTELGHIPSQIDINQHPSPFVAIAPTFQRRFGSWSKALLYAGYLPENHARGDVRQLDKVVQYLIDHDGMHPRADDYTNVNMLPSRPTTTKLFGAVLTLNALAHEQYDILGKVTDVARAGRLITSPDAQSIQQTIAGLSESNEHSTEIDEPLLLRFFDKDLKDGLPLAIVRDIWTIPIEPGSKIRRVKNNLGRVAYNIAGCCVVRYENDEVLFNGTRLPIDTAKPGKQKIIYGENRVLDRVF